METTIRSAAARGERSARPLKVGLVLPQMEGMMAGGAARWSNLAAMARLAEDTGFDSLWVIDHFLIDGLRQPGLKEGLWECWSLLAALAATTRRVEIGPLVSSTNFRNPALLAKIADTVDEISGGRLILGLGAGWYEAEHHAFGYPFDHRVSRFEEALKIVRPLLREGRADFAGEYYRARECELRPRSSRPGSPPILIGALAHRERMLRLVAEHADMWNAWLAFGRSHPDQIPPLRAALNAACAEVERDPATLKRTAGVLVDVSGEPTLPAWVPGGNIFGPLEPLNGSPEEIAESLRAFAREGISHVQVWLAPNSLGGIEAFAPVLELLNAGGERGEHVYAEAL
jgi:alkanesulfonate monooxygenase SsuD/methylene tetrahydromethanopterin reductase-like flavin-dependent oxidoreductase (luciferase family)